MINVITEAEVQPPRVVLYGPEGVGKTHFGAHAESPFFICTERGADKFAIPKVKCGTYAEVREVFKYLAIEKHEYKNIFIDSIDWLEALLIEHICKEDKKESIEDFGFGKGYVKLEEATAQLIKGLDYLVSKGMAVWLLAHAKIEAFQDPEIDQPIHRWQMKCHKRTTPLYKEWCDALLFCSPERSVIDGKAKGRGKTKIFGEWTAARDAKNRYGIPDGTELDYAKIKPYLNGEM